MLKYNVAYRMKRGQFYDIADDMATLERNHRSLNLLDLGRKKEFFLLDHYSDATEFGGLSLTQLHHNLEEGSLRLQAKFIRDKSGL